MMLRHAGGDFFGSCKTSILLNSPDKGMSPTGSSASWGAAGGNAAAGGTRETLERRGWDALREGPHGNALYIINNVSLFMVSDSLLLCHMSKASSWLHLHSKIHTLWISKYLNDAKETFLVT